jgi:hypothetical protein
MIIEMRKIEDFEGFMPNEFCVDTKYWGYGCELLEKVPEEMMAEATEKAKGVDGVCVAIIHPDDGGWSYAIGASVMRGCAGRFVLFNAETTGRCDAEVRVVIFNRGRGARTKYLYKKLIRYRPGSIIK